MRSCISVCHVSAGDSWAGIENPVATLLRALSTYPQLDLSAIVLQDGRLARELRSFGIAVRVVNEEQKSFPTRHLRLLAVREEQKCRCSALSQL